MSDVKAAAERKIGLAKSRTPEYMSWTSMRQRCLNVKHRAYKNYGGRGILICEEWVNSFERFLKDVGQRPSLNHSLDRINNDGNYEKSNVRWASKQTQRRNSRASLFLEIDGIKKTAFEWSCDPGAANYAAILKRIERGWDHKDAVFMENLGCGARGSRNSHSKLSETDAERILREHGSGSEIAARYGVSKATVNGIRSGKHWKHLKSLSALGIEVKP